MALQHLRSSTANKRPIPAVMSAGQIAVNTHEGSPGLFFKDSNGDLVKVGPVHIGTSAPNSSPDSVAATALVTGTVYQILTVGNSDFTLVGASANTVGTVFTATGTTTGTGTVSGQQGNEKGEQWLDTTGSAFDLKIYDGTAWRSQAGEFVNVTGDTMTGAFGVVAGTASAPGVFFSGDTNTGLLSPGGDSVAITTGGTQRIVVDSSGRLGVATSSPSHKLDVRENNTAAARIGGSTFAIEIGQLSSSSSPGFNVLGASGAMLFRLNGTEAMRLDPSGRLLVGTTTEGYSTADDLTIASAGSTGMTIRSGTSNYGSIFFSDATSGSGEYVGAIQYHHGSNFLTIGTNGSEHLRINSSGNVGIGTSSPGAKLDVNGEIYISPNTAGKNTFQFTTNASNDGRLKIKSDTTDKVDIQANGVSYFNGGNVGIGTSSPSQKLHIQDSSGPLLTFDDATTQFGSLGSYNRLVGSGAIDTFLVSSANSKPLVLRAPTGQTISFDIASSEAMRIDSSGRVGIGTSSPENLLHVENNGTVAIQIEDTSTSTRYRLENFDSGLQFVESGVATRMRIDSSGRLLVNGTTATGDNKLQVISSDASINSLTIGRGKNSVASNTALGDHALFTNTTGSSNTAVGLNTLYYVTSGSNNTGVGKSALQQTTGSNNTAVGAAALYTNNAGSDNTAVGWLALYYNQTGNNNTAVGRYALSSVLSGNKNIGIGYTAGDAITTGSNNTIIGDIAGSATLSDTVIIGAGATERMRIDSSGRVAIGTSSALTGSTLTVAGNALAVTGQNTAHSANSIRIGEEGSGAAQIRCYGPDASTNGSLTLRVNRSDGSDPKDVKIDSSGNVGIGVSPFTSGRVTAPHLVVGSGSNSPGLTLYGASSAQASLNFGDSTSGTGAYDGGLRYAFGSGSPYLGFHVNGGTERMRIDSSGRLLVGTTTEGRHNADNLTIADSGNCGITVRSGSTDYGSLYFSDGTSGTNEYDGYIDYYHLNQEMRFATGATERMRIDSSGNVGIGTTSPARLFEVKQNASGNFDAAKFTNGQDNGSSDSVSINFGLARTGGLAFDAAKIKAVKEQAFTGTPSTIDAALVFETIQNENSSEKMRISSSGNVGIGTSSPLALLDVAVLSTGSRRLLVSYADSIITLQGANSSATNENLRLSADKLIFATGGGTGTENARFNANRYYQVSNTGGTGSTRYSDSAQYHTYHTNRNNSVTAIFESTGDSSPYGIYLQFSQTAPDNNGNYFISCEDSTTSRFYVWSDGDVVNHDNSYGAISDIKLKQDIVDSGSQWNDLKDLRVRKFRFKTDVADYGDDAKTLIGLVAQEAELVSPGLVKESPDTDKDGNELGTTTKSVNYSVLYMKAVKALQEAMERIEQLETKVAALEAG